MRLEYTALGVLLFSIASCVADYDATEDLYGHIVFFKHLDSSSWLGLTGDETMTIDIGEDDIRAYDPQLGLRNKFEKPASAPEFKIIENIMGIDDNGGDIANRPPRPSRNFFSGQELAEQLQTETNYLRDKNINPIQFWKHNKNETYSKDMQWRVMCTDDSMENCTIMNVKYREFLFSYGKNASLGTKPACSESNIEDCPHECETNADCFDRGQCVTCQSNECRVWELCCDCLSCPCDELYGNDLEANAVCQKEMKCGLCGGHCADVTDPCPIVENPVCKPFDPPEPADPEPLGPPFRWKVIRPNFTSNETIILDSGCNEREEEAYEVIPYWTGIVMHKNASWNWSDDVANDLLTRIENGDITGEGADKWMKEPDETWRMGESHHLPVTIPYAHKAVVKQLQGKYGNPSDPVYTVYGEVSLIQIKSCPLPLRPGCIDDEVGGHTPPECPMFPKHHWQYEPREVKFRPHDTGKK